MDPKDQLWLPGKLHPPSVLYLLWMVCVCVCVMFVCVCVVFNVLYGMCDV